MRDGSLHVFATAGFNDQRTTGVFVIRPSHDVVVDHALARYSFDHIQLLKFLTPKLFVKKKMFIPIGSMYMLYMVTFTINIPQMLAYIPYMDPMRLVRSCLFSNVFSIFMDQIN